MDQKVNHQFLQVLLKAYQLGEGSKEMTTDQVLKEIIPQLKSMLASMQPS